MKLVLTILIVLVSASVVFADGVVVKQSTCKVDWDAPQTNADNTNLADLKEYGVYVTTTTTPLPPGSAPTAVVAAPELDPVAGRTGQWQCNQLVPGQYYVQIDAVDTSANRSVRSPMLPFVSKDDVPPSGPPVPRVTGQ